MATPAAQQAMEPTAFKMVTLKSGIDAPRLIANALGLREQMMDKVVLVKDLPSSLADAVVERLAAYTIAFIGAESAS